MLKGHVFSKQIFGNPMFALFINTFLNGRNGVSNNYKNGMQVTYSGSNLSIVVQFAYKVVFWKKIQEVQLQQELILHIANL